MNRLEYAILALAGDLTVDDLSILQSHNIGLKELTTSRIELLNERKQKQIISKCRSVEKKLKEFRNFITFQDQQYPEKLKASLFPPPVLFYEGNPDILNEENSLAIVGSRKATQYGLKLAESFSRELDNAGLCIISGLAVGIDGAAHRGSLQSTGKTVAVLGSGIDIVYPKSNRKLFSFITEHGCIVSEFLPGTPPMKYNFPRRNRIIVGLSKAVLVVEATKRSGSLITARLALDNGRDVFAIPGDINKRSSEGTNWLIQNGAKLILSIEDILEEFPTVSRSSSKDIQIKSSVLKVLSEFGELEFSELLEHTKLEHTELLLELTRLQLEGLVTESTGKWRANIV
ncbi:DNA-processing protein DprA [Kosmotoga olearia]|uniref:DNA protecting protein DprA n=1 Tax=Kosmotoga olearia (strain ATCC BAA-1733 / DSM 21960 / TBF 19.5.1) TaxID=521045 RepID=C5CFD3_KOSOT|nr:DNA-processing protein DprA [Kosmotoga olearia]ACR80342.1 DNA protecting protein DprA [Kosmotoga olearia TBF 19.5.1]